jgi:hypothetical protein
MELVKRHGHKHRHGPDALFSIAEAVVDDLRFGHASDALYWKLGTLIEILHERGVLHQEDVLKLVGHTFAPYKGAPRDT